MRSLHLLQARATDSSQGIAIAKQILINKCRNMESVLTRSIPNHARTGESSAKLLASLFAMRQRMSVISDIRDRQHLFLVEAQVARAYWSAFRILAHAPMKWRRIHPNAIDPWNQALNIGYTILLQKMRSLIMSEGLDPEIGIFHASKSGKDALVYDLMELFRQPIVDLAVIRVFSRQTAPFATDPHDVIREVAIRCARNCAFHGRVVTRELAMKLEVARFKKTLTSGLPFVPTYIRL